MRNYNNNNFFCYKSYKFTSKEVKIQKKKSLKRQNITEEDNSGKVKVVCRFRPMNSFEVIHGGSMDIKIREESCVDIKQVEFLFIK